MAAALCAFAFAFAFAFAPARAFAFALAALAADAAAAGGNGGSLLLRAAWRDTVAGGALPRRGRLYARGGPDGGVPGPGSPD
jgi:hypothetical protein